MHAKLVPLDVPSVLLMDHALPVSQAMVKTLRVSVSLVPPDVINVALMESVLHVLLLAMSNTTLPKHASLAVLAVLPVLLPMERLLSAPNVTTIMLSLLLLAPAKLAILANTSKLRAKLILAQPVPLENSTRQVPMPVLPAQMPNVRLALVKRLDNAQLATMASILSVELAEARVLPLPKELDQLLEV